MMALREELSSKYLWGLTMGNKQNQLNTTPSKFATGNK